MSKAQIAIDMELGELGVLVLEQYADSPEPELSIEDAAKKWEQHNCPQIAALIRYLERNPHAMFSTNHMMIKERTYTLMMGSMNPEIGALAWFRHLAGRIEFVAEDILPPLDNLAGVFHDADSVVEPRHA